jgi:hypothetical protein
MCIDSCTGGDAPQPPNPIATAAAQTGTNVSTAVANAFLNNANQVTPLGSLTYDTSSSPPFSWSDPTTGQTYSIPRFTVRQTLGPTQQATQDQQEQAKLRMATLGNTQSARLNQLLAGNIDLSQAGAPGDADQFGAIPGAQTSFGDAGQLLTGYGDAGPVPTTYGGQGDYARSFDDAGGIARDYGPNDFSADRSRVEQSLFERMQPQLDRQRTQLEQQLADQGIRYGSSAYSAAMDDFNRQLTDTRLGVIAQGGQEQKLQADLAAQRAGFANAAQQQAYLQAQGRGTFANTAQQAAAQEAQQRGAFAQQGQQSLAEQLAARATFTNQAQQAAFQQAATRGGFANTALQQQVARVQAEINARNTARAQYLQEQYALRNQPINEISALLSGSQVQQPQFMQTPQQQIPTTDYASLINQNFQQQFQNYQTQQQAQNQLLGGIIGAAGHIGAGFALSDRRAKEDITRVGSVFAMEPNTGDGERKQLPIYKFSYKDDAASMKHVGPMAQDVEKIDKGAVTSIGGRKHIDTGRVMGSILRAA